MYPSACKKQYRTCNKHICVVNESDRFHKREIVAAQSDFLHDIAHIYHLSSHIYTYLKIAYLELDASAYIQLRNIVRRLNFFLAI